MGVDFEFIPRPLTKKEKEKINKIIQDFKKKQAAKTSSPKQKNLPNRKSN